MQVEYLTEEVYERAEERGISRDLLYGRIYRLGWTIEKALTYQKEVPLWDTWKELSEANGVSYQMFQYRLRKGMTPEAAVETGRLSVNWKQKAKENS